MLILAFVVQAGAMAAAGARLRRRAPTAAALLIANAAATVVLAAARVSCGAADVDWCVPSEHPASSAVHGVAATIALVALTLAPPAVAISVGRSAPRLAASGLAAGAVMLPLLAWFVVADSAGWAEKAVVTVGIFWAAAAATTQLERT